jgi:TrkA domain protein
MTVVNETNLPGVGVRYDFDTKAGDQLGVIAHRTGRFDLLLYDHDDPDSCATVLRLDEDDAHTLADVLGGSQVAQRQVDLQQALPGLTIDWVPISTEWSSAGQTIQELGIRPRTGASIVAILRDGETFASPGPDFQLQSGDTAVMVGTPEGIRLSLELLQRG